MKKKIKKIIVVIAVFAIVASILMGVTSSKYVSEITGNGQMEVAKWKFTVNGEEEQIETIKLVDTYNENTLLNGKIAPGTSGSFDLVIDATSSEVGIEYIVDFRNETSKPSNLKFKCGEEVFDEIEEYETYFSGIIDANDTEKTRTLTIEWEWPYETENDKTIEENDVIDTKDAMKLANYTFDVVVIGTQVIPQKAQ